MTILLVEDEASCREIIKIHLLKFKDSFYSLEIYEAENVTVAKEIYDQREPDMVILDGSLPDSPFEETLKIIPRFADKSAVIILTNQEKMEGVAQAFKLGAVDYLTKQVLTNGKDFVKTLQSAWSNYERQRIRQTGAFPTLRAKQVSEELVSVAEKQMTQPELKSLIEFSQFARANIDSLQKKIDKVYQTIFEGNGTPSMKQDISEVKDGLEEIKKKLDDSVELDKAKSSERWKFLGIIAVPILGGFSIFAKFAVDWLEKFFSLH